MKYNKPPLTYEEQSDLLLSRGLIADKAVLVQRLKSVNYYRLSGYLHTFRMMDERGQRLDQYYPDTSLDMVWRRYTFDRQLRLLVLDGIERIEVALKTKITQIFSLKYGSFGYLDKKNLPRLSFDKHQKFLERVRQETERSKEDFVKHFKDKYGDNHKDLPLWMAVEIMSYGSLLTLYNGIAKHELKTIAAEFNLTLPLLDSWIMTLNTIRNICAHHGRLWNRELGIKPKIPNLEKYPEWHNPVATPSDRVFSVLTIIKYLLRYIAPQSAWHIRFQCLLSEYPDIPLAFMGFPEKWQEHAIWLDINKHVQ
jgi:abortive infection bacteriophage resistance protein